MTKRKRLAPVTAKGASATPSQVVTSPIAQVSGDAAVHSALEEVTAELQAARNEGRMVVSLPLDAIEVDHLVRDRMFIDPDDMEALKSSIRARGQQTPIEVVDLGGGAYGLISGWRRLSAVRALAEEGAGPEFARIQALVRRVHAATDAYVAMVEENEIRADLSFFERARLAVEAARLGLYTDARQAIQALFARASAPKRSKVAAFVTLYDALGGVLKFPHAIPERLGLALSSAIQSDAAFAARLKDALRKTPADTVEQERKALEKALRRVSRAETAAKPAKEAEAQAVRVVVRGKTLVLSGDGVDDALRRDLLSWLAARGLG